MSSASPCLTTDKCSVDLNKEHFLCEERCHSSSETRPPRSLQGGGPIYLQLIYGNPVPAENSQLPPTDFDVSKQHGSLWLCVWSLIWTRVRHPPAAHARIVHLSSPPRSEYRAEPRAAASRLSRLLYLTRVLHRPRTCACLFGHDRLERPRRHEGLKEVNSGEPILLERRSAQSRA